MPENVTSWPIYRGHKSDYFYYERHYVKPSNPTPIQITIAKVEKTCPRCATKGKRFDLGISNGNIFGGLCLNCGWSF